LPKKSSNFGATKVNFMSDQKLSPRFIVLIGLVFAAAMTRLLPHPPNFAPFGALALFGAAYFKKPVVGLLVTLAALGLSDFVLNNTIYAAFDYQFQWAVYLGFTLIFVLGFFLLKKVSFQNVLVSAIAASVVFFLVSNFGTWMSGIMPFPKTGAGLLAAYAAGLPMFIYTVLGDLFYCAVLFGSFELMKQRFPVLSFAK